MGTEVLCYRCGSSRVYLLEGQPKEQLEEYARFNITLLRCEDCELVQNHPGKEVGKHPELGPWPSPKVWLGLALSVALVLGGALWRILQNVA